MTAVKIEGGPMTDPGTGAVKYESQQDYQSDPVTEKSTGLADKITEGNQTEYVSEPHDGKPTGEVKTPGPETFRDSFFSALDEVKEKDAKAAEMRKAKEKDDHKQVQKSENKSRKSSKRKG